MLLGDINIQFRELRYRRVVRRWCRRSRRVKIQQEAVSSLENMEEVYVLKIKLMFKGDLQCHEHVRNLPTRASGECQENLVASSSSSCHHFRNRPLSKPRSSSPSPSNPFQRTLRLVLSSQRCFPDLQSENRFCKISFSLVKLTSVASIWSVQDKVDSMSMSSSL